MASYNMARYQNRRARVLEETNEHILARVTQISDERAPTEEAGRLLMAAEWQRLTEAAGTRFGRQVQASGAGQHGPHRRRCGVAKFGKKGWRGG